MHAIRLDLGREGEGKNKPTANNIKSRLLAHSLELLYECYMKDFVGRYLQITKLIGKFPCCKSSLGLLKFGVARGCFQGMVFFLLTLFKTL